MSRSASLNVGYAATAHDGRTPASAALDHLPDGVLLDRFLLDRDEAAFEALVRRHAPGVMRACLRRLADRQEAEDACQATFLVLVTRAGEIRRSDSVGAWLRGVARRVAGRARIRADRRRVREGDAMDVESAPGREGPALDDAIPILRAEVDRLPERYRRPIELCYWEGLSSDQAAVRLGCPTGTLKWRLFRARETLQGRLARVGVSLAALLLLGRPAATEAGMSGPGTSGLGGEWPDGAGGLADFARATTALAALVRDAAPAAVVPDPGGAGEGAVGRRKRKRSPYPTRIAAVAAAILLGVPALCLAVPEVGRIPGAIRDAIFPPAPVFERDCHGADPAAPPQPGDGGAG